MADVSGMKNEIRRRGQCVDLGDSGLQGAGYICIGGLVETHVAVTDLDEAKFSLGILACDLGKTAEAVGLQDPAFHHAKGAGTGPRHTFQETSPVNSVMVVVMQEFVFGFLSHLLSSFKVLRSGVGTLPCGLFQ